MWTVECNKALNARLAAAVEDPFDATDNCARTIGFSRIDSIVDAFGRAAAVMNAARGDAGSFLQLTACTSDQHEAHILSVLFSSPIL